jgi:hypothetical protein
MDELGQRIGDMISRLLEAEAKRCDGMSRCFQYEFCGGSTYCNTISLLLRFSMVDLAGYGISVWKSKSDIYNQVNCPSLSLTEGGLTVKYY